MLVRKASHETGLFDAGEVHYGIGKLFDISLLGIPNSHLLFPQVVNCLLCS